MGHVVKILAFGWGKFQTIWGSSIGVIRGRWVAKLSERWVAKLVERWVVKLVSRLAVTAALWVRIQTSLKNIQNGRHRKWSGHHTLARKKNI